jgi:hypothetical protein
MLLLSILLPSLSSSLSPPLLLSIIVSISSTGPSQKLPDLHNPDHDRWHNYQHALAMTSDLVRVSWGSLDGPGGALILSGLRFPSHCAVNTIGWMLSLFVQDTFTVSVIFFCNHPSTSGKKRRGSSNSHAAPSSESCSQCMYTLCIIHLRENITHLSLNGSTALQKTMFFAGLLTYIM